MIEFEQQFYCFTSEIALKEALMGMEGLLEKVTTAACAASVESQATIVLSGQGAGETLT